MLNAYDPVEPLLTVRNEETLEPTLYLNRRRRRSKLWRTMRTEKTQVESEKNGENETEVGEALAEVFKTGLVKREDLFITKKILAEMDRFNKDDNLVVIAATNRLDTLDPHWHWESALNLEVFRILGVVLI
ncbi:NADP-dependent D-sorbitol-6-phosphate dehydrogenase [Artemisia annua]|uniref:NADP-dependent D-sorbitol-6-phosphate dehydrogenase n=1 Tax=Artemisia annua TaxID=35608 RepID=A0A2U1N4E3_ARTAN|nr:NADP-dependent D-sorbitol-6-phosphate dehydrogenase [Artemisia annua]